MKEQKFNVGDRISVTGWGGGPAAIGTVADIAWVYHNRLHEHTWGCRIDFGEGHRNPFTMTYIPQGYLTQL